jgi:hypothetical protein
MSPRIQPDDITRLLHGDDGPDRLADRLPIALTMTLVPPTTSPSAAHDSDGHRLHQHLTVFGGEPDAVVNDLNRYIDAGVSHLLVAFRCSDVDAVEDGMAWFNELVRPRLAEPRMSADHECEE